MKNKKYIIIYATLIMCLCIMGCKGKASKKENEKQIPIITVTIEPQRYITEAIAGDKFKVVSMLPKGASPETYDPIPQQLVSLGKSSAYMRIGYIGFERSWIDKLMENTPHIQMFNTAKGVDLIFNDTHNHQVGKGSETEQEGHLHKIEPHIWNSTTNALIIANNTYQALCKLDKANESYYMARYDSLCQRIHHTDSLIRQELSKPGCSKAFMIYHPALSYFARDYGLQQIAIEENGKEPSTAHLKELIDLCKQEKIEVIFIQPEFDRRNAESIAAQTQTKVVPINPLNYNWETEMLRIAKALSGSEE